MEKSTKRDLPICGQLEESMYMFVCPLSILPCVRCDIDYRNTIA